MNGNGMRHGRPANWRDFQGTGVFLASFAVLGILGISFQPALDRWVAFLFALVSCGCGALIGFLYGIPRSAPHVAVSTGAHSVVVAGPTAGNVGASVAEPEPAPGSTGSGAAKPTDAAAARTHAVAATLPADSAKHDATAVAPSSPATSTGAAARVAASGAAVPSTVADPAASALPTTKDANTNLEEIADWLTKILLGAGLTQVAKLPDALEAMAKKVTPIAGPGAANVVPVVISTWLFFGVLGFFMGYLMTRLFVAGALTRADSASPSSPTAG